MIQIKTLKQLKELCADNPADGFIQLNGGLKSSKIITYHPKSRWFVIENSIDGSTQTLTARQINDKQHTNIGQAIKKGALYLDIAGHDYVCECGAPATHNIQTIYHNYEITPEGEFINEDQWEGNTNEFYCADCGD